MKLPFSFNIKFAFRLLLPGFIISIGFSPILQALVELFSTNLEVVPFAGIILIAAIVFGWLLVIMDMHIYMVFEGRRYWPNNIRFHFLKKEQKRLAKIQKEYSVAYQTMKKLGESGKTDSLEYLKNQNTYLEHSVRLRNFSVDDTGERKAYLPTRLGNLIYAYEAYPDTVYGADGIFYWYRIWLSIDNDLRENLDDLQAIADSAIYSSFSLLICAFLCPIYACLSWLNVELFHFLPGYPILLFAFPALLAISYLIYRISIQFHRSYGEMFRALFDVFLEKIEIDQVVETVGTITGENHLKSLASKHKFKIAWRYLNHYKVRIKGVNVPFLDKEKIERQKAASQGNNT